MKKANYLMLLSIMGQKAIKTKIRIAATPETIWEHLSNFDEYKNWNPFIRSVIGEPVVGSKIRIIAGDMKFKPIILVSEKNREIRWLGKVYIKGIFDGEHSFIIENNGDGTCTFRHEEVFNGILVGLFSTKLERDVKPGFLEMNQKLKDISESQ